MQDRSNIASKKKFIKQKETYQMSIISHKELKETLSYNPCTGVFNWIGKYKSKIAGGIKGNGRVYIRINGKDYQASRLAWYYMTTMWPEHLVEHKNRICSDNSWDNLRASNHSENKQNTELLSNNTSGYKGVSFVKKTGKWRASITIDKKQYRLGTFKHLINAAKAADDARKKAFGEFYADIYSESK